MARRAKNMLAKGCGCFEAGHLVWTTRELIPIESVQIDDFVIAQDETTGQTTLRRVIDTFMRRGAPIVAITITSAAGAGETFRTTEEHPFHVPNAVWVRADHLTPGDRVTSLGGEPATVAWISYTGERATVFNLEVEGLHEYYVGASGLLVHNGSIFDCFKTFRFPNPKKFEKAFDKHAADFGITGGKSLTNAQAFTRNVESFISSARSKQINYFGSGTATVYYKGPGKPAVVLRPDGSWWTGYRLTEDQFLDIVRRGYLR